MTSAPTDREPPFSEEDGWDDRDGLELLPNSRLRIAVGLGRVDRWQRRHSATAPLNREVIEQYHRTIFVEVFPAFAGRMRGPGPRLDEVNSEFGFPRAYFGEPFETVVSAVDELGRLCEANLQYLDEAFAEARHPNFFDEICAVAAYVHCRLIQIHPFRNGNGRTARACINHFFRRYGLPPCAILHISKSVEQDYLDAMRSFLQYGKHQHLSYMLYSGQLNRS